MSRTAGSRGGAPGSTTGARGPSAEQQIDPSVFIAPSAQLFGAISIARGASIWHNAVLRAECQRIEIGRMTNLQDFAMVHIAFDQPTIIGEFCSITHHATVHGCTIGDHCLIGINTVVMDRAVIGAGSIVAGGAIVTEGIFNVPGVGNLAYQAALGGVVPVTIAVVTILVLIFLVFNLLVDIVYALLDPRIRYA